jgi:hypothetical protein
VLVGAGMQAMGHPVSNNTPDVGGMQGIYFKRDFSLPEPVQPPEGTRWTPSSGNPLFGLGPAVNGVYRSASDPRKDGHAVGW